MANLQSGTRIYGTANVDAQINVGFGNAVINSTGFFVNNSIMASNAYVQTLAVSLGVYVSNAYFSANVIKTGTLTLSTSNLIFSGAGTIVANNVGGNYGQALVANSGGGMYWGYPLQTMIVAMSDETTTLLSSSLTPVITLRAPYALNLVSPYCRIGVATGSSSGSITIDIKVVGGSSIFTTPPTITVGANTSAATPPVMATTAIADDAQLQFFITAAGTSAKSLKTTLYFVHQ
jgi:hypothetical protein